MDHTRATSSPPRRSEPLISVDLCHRQWWSSKVWCRCSPKNLADVCCPSRPAPETSKYRSFPKIPDCIVSNGPPSWTLTSAPLELLRLLLRALSSRERANNRLASKKLRCKKKAREPIENYPQSINLGVGGVVGGKSQFSSIRGRRTGRAVVVVVVGMLWFNFLLCSVQRVCVSVSCAFVWCRRRWCELDPGETR